MTLSKMLVGAGVAVLLAGTAHATTITQSITFATGPTDFSSALGINNATLLPTLSLFDTTLGTLNSVTLGASYQFNSTITVTNASLGPANGTISTQSGAQFGSNRTAVTAVLNSVVNNNVDVLDGNQVKFGNNVLTPVAFDIRGSGQDYNLNVLNPVLVTTSTGTMSKSVTDTSAADLAAFSAAGGGNFIPVLSTLTGVVQSSNTGNVNTTQLTTAGGTLTISYNYTAAATVIPEPATLSVLGASLFGLGLARRRRGA